MPFFNLRSARSLAVIFSLFLLIAVAGAAAGQQSAGSPAPAPSTSQSPAQPAAKPQAAPQGAAKPDNAPPTPPGANPGFPKGLDPKTMSPVYTTIQEDWSSLQIGTSKLTPMPPLVAETDDKEHFTRQLVQVQWRPGDPIDLYVILPKGVKNPPVVLYLYNFSEGSDRFKDDRWCDRVTNGGVGAAGFVSALSADRFHDRPMKQWFVSELQESLGSTVHDVKFILDYLASRGDVDMNRVGMFGQGSGATIAVLAAAADSRIKAVDLMDPWGDWPDWLAKSSVVSDDPEHAEYVKPAFLKKVAPLDPVKYLPTMTTTKIRLQQVLESANPIETQDKLKDVLPRQAEVYRFTTALVIGKREGGGRLFEWIKTQLTPVPDKGGPMKTAASENEPAQSN